MSYVRAVEGETNSEVIDPAFHRRVQPPSQAREMRTTGIPAPPVASINRPQMFSFPRPASPTATSDLRGQSSVSVTPTPAVRQQGNIISAERSAAIAQQRRAGQRAAEVLAERRREGMGGLGQIRRPTPASALVLSAQIAAQRGDVSTVAHMLGQEMRRRKGLTGLGEVTFTLPTTAPAVVIESQQAAYEAALKAPPSATYAAQLAEQLIKAGILKGTDAILFKNLSPAQQQQYIKAAAPAAPGVADQISGWLSGEAIAGVPNGVLAAGAGLFFLILSGKKGRR